MRILVIVTVLCTLFSIGCSNYDTGRAAYERGHYEMALYDFEQRAKDGDRVAQFCLGYMYKYGEGLTADSDEAAKLYKKAAKQNYAPAQNNLAVIYLQQAEDANNKYVGVEVTLETTEEWSRTFKEEWLPKYNDAMHWFQKAAVQQNNRIAQYNLALTWYQRARTFERVTAQIDEILRLLDEDSADPDVQELMKVLKDSEFSNLPSDAVEAYEEAVSWFTKSAEQSYHRAQYELGNRYYYNQGVEELSEIQRWEKAVDWYKKAKKHNTGAHHNLAKMYAEGKGVDKDIEKAKKLYKEIATPEQNYKGYAPAQFELGKMYHNGNGIERDLTKAIEWYTKAAEQNDDAAQNNLAVIYSNLAHKYAEGEGVPKNSKKAGLYFERAVRSYFKAAQQGHPVAQANIGRNFETGFNSEAEMYVVPQDNAEAYYWYSLALKDPTRLNKLAVPENYAAIVTKWREGVESKLENCEKDEIQDRVNNWKPKILIGSGTGFYVDERHILTNAHVIIDSNKHKYDELRIGFRYVVVKPGAESVDDNVDLALLFDRSGNPADTAIFRRTSVEVPEEVSVFGYPKSFDLSYKGNFTSGTVSGLSDTIDVPKPSNRFQHTAPTQRGNSGGPVFDSAGNVVGVSVAGFPDRYFDKDTLQYLNIAQNINFAIKFNVIEEFLKKNNVKIVPKTTRPKEDVGDPISRRKKIFQNAQKFTMPVLCYKNKEDLERLPVVQIAIMGIYQ